MRRGYPKEVLELIWDGQRLGGILWKNVKLVNFPTMGEIELCLHAQPQIKSTTTTLGLRKRLLS